MYDFLLLLYNNLNVNVLHYDYIGYGLIKEKYGVPTEQTTYESIEAAHKFLNDNGIENKDIIIFGTSVGSGPSCHIASKEKNLKGLVLECPFLSCIRVVTKSIFLRPVDMFCNVNKIGLVSCPVFIIHGGVDEVINQEHGKELFSNIPKNYQYTPKWIPEANHHDIIDTLGIKEYLKLLNDFLKNIVMNLIVEKN